MKRRIFLIIFTGIFLAVVGIRPLRAANAVVGDGTPASCNEANFDNALKSVQNSGSGTITFNCGGAAAISFDAGKIITSGSAVTIDGGTLITLSGVNKVRHFYVESNASLTVKNITLTNGFDDTYGGGSILNLGVLALDNATIQDSNVDAGHSGGAIMSQGPLTIENSLIENNGGGSAGGLFIIGEDAGAVISGTTLRGNQTTSTQYGLGGAISNWNDADVTIRSSTLIQNQANAGGAIYNESAFLTVEAGTIVEGNHAINYGGGIYNTGGFINISDATLTNNVARIEGGGIYNDLGTVSLMNTIVNNNGARGGGGILNLDGTVILNSSVLNSNSANSGGALTNAGFGSLTLTNVTISNNEARSSGGGILTLRGTVTLFHHVTMSNNTSPDGGGIVISRDANVTLKNVIINGGKEGENCVRDLNGNLTSNGFNLSSDNSCGFNQGGDQNNVDPMLGPLADNGGSTLTHMLLPSSPALDAGQCIDGLTTDQRGLPRLQGNACDIGALERQPGDGTSQSAVYLPVVIK